MKEITKIINKAWNNRKGPIIFTTVNKQGIPNSIYATCVSKIDDNKIVVANNFFNKTIENIFSGSMGSILFITNDDKSYQLKGTIGYFTEGDFFKDMKKWNPVNLPGHGAAIIEITEIYAGAEKLL